MRICFDQRNGNGCGTENRTAAQHCRQCGASLRFALTLADPGARIGPYQIVGVLGHGGFGAVYEAEDTRRAGQRIALKENFDTTSLSSFQGEFAVLHQLSNPHLPRYYEVFEAHERGYLVMELVQGQSLADIVERQNGPLLESQVLGFALQLCDGLSYLHSQQPPVIHRDIKPANIRLSPDGIVKLVDFGLFKQGSDPTQLSRRGLTPDYAPIEQWGGENQRTDPRSDIYSLGATLYHLLTGQKPISAAYRIAVDRDPLLSPRTHNPKLAPHVAETLLTAMSLTQKERFDDALALKYALMSGGKIDSEPQLRNVLHGHTSGVLSAAWSSDGRTLASASADMTVCVWQAESGTLLQTLRGHTGDVTHVAWSADNRTLASSSKDRTVRLWAAHDGALLCTLEGHTGEASCIAFDTPGTMLASASADRTVRLWNVADGSTTRILDHPGSLKHVAWSSDGHLLASTGRDSTVWLWRVDDGTLLHTLREPGRGRRYMVYLDADYMNTCAVFSPDGQLLVSTSGEKTILVWRVADGTLLRTLDGHTDTVVALAFSPDGRTLASASRDKTARLWRVGDGALLHTLDGHSDVVTDVAYRPDGRALATTSNDATLRLWRV